MKKSWWAVAALFFVTLAAYWPALHAGFVWNDSDYVTQPQLRSLHGLWRIWFDLGATEQYYPLLHSAFWIEHILWGDAAMGYHVANVLLHATAACLFWMVLRRLRIPCAWLAAFIFALHPVCVESVAWISEQKNTLSIVFYLAAALVYLGKTGGTTTVSSVFVRPADTEVGPPVSSSAYLLSTSLFVCALLSKSVTATLPAALLVVFWWQRGRLSWKRDVLPLIPWLGLGAASGLFSAWVERTYIGAQGSAFALNFVQRCLIAGREIWFYLGKLFWPANLIFIYPHWQVDAGAWWQYLFPLAAVALVAALWAIRRRSRGPLAGLLFFAGSLFPVLGFFNVYAFKFSYVADHFQYLAMMGVIAAAAAAITRAMGDRRWAMGIQGQGAAAQGSKPIAYRPSPIAWAPLVLLCLLGALTWRQCRMYADVQTFYQAILARNPESWMAHVNLGMIQLQAGDASGAIRHFNEALRLEPDNAEARNDLGLALSQSGHREEAIAQYDEALRLEPDYAEAHNGLGLALAGSGRLAEAIVHYRRALQIKPAYAEAHNNLGIALAGAGRLPEAVVELKEALRIKPDYAKALVNLGGVYATENRLPEALAQFQEAARVEPDFAGAHFNLANALMQEGRSTEAMAEYARTLRINPNYAAAHYNFGLALRSAGREEEARVQFEEAARLGGSP